MTDNTWLEGGALDLWSRRSLATLVDRSLIPGVGNKNVLVTRLDVYCYHKGNYLEIKNKVQKVD